MAVLLNKVVLEYVPKFGQSLAESIRSCGQWIREEARKELSEFYVSKPGETPIGYFWARTVVSEAPGQGIPVEIPLLRSLWLCRKPNRKIALRWQRNADGQIEAATTSVRYANGDTKTVRRPLLEVFEPETIADVESGTSAGGKATCPISGFTMPVENVRKQLLCRQGGASDSRLICVAVVTEANTGRTYRLPSNHEITVLEDVSKRVAAAQRNGGELSAIPDEKLNHLRGFFNVVLYGMETWGDLFTPRQKLVLLTLTRLINESVERAKNDTPEMAEALQTCLALVISRMADGNSSLASWQNTGEKIGHTFGRQALLMIWDYTEANPFCSATRSLESMFEWIAKIPEREQSLTVTGQAERASATCQMLPDDSADCFVTDPPYYAAVPYADLSDFFYTWLRRLLRRTHPQLFSSTLTPKDEECVQLSHRAAMYRNKDKGWFEAQMTKACEESRRTTRPSGIGVVVFASKETSAWEAMLKAIVDAGWIITASWPIDTEMGTRLRAMNSATLASSIHIVCRPREDKAGLLRREVGEWHDVLSELPKRIHDWMPRLAEEGIVGADAIFACLGPALEVYSRYSRVEKASGEVVTLREYLEQVWAAVSNEALSLIFKDADAASLEPDARLTAMWLWTLGAGGNGDAAGADDEAESDDGDEEEASGKGKAATGGYTLEYDAARKIAQGLGVHLEQIESVVEVKGDKARLCSVAERTRHLFGKDEAAPAGTRRKKKPAQKTLFEELDETESLEGSWSEMKGPALGETVLDRVHQAMILFAAGRSEAVKRFLVEDGAGTDARFWKLAQSLSALYPKDTDEKRWVDGVLARKKGLGL